MAGEKAKIEQWFAKNKITLSDTMHYANAFTATLENPEKGYYIFVCAFYMDFIEDTSLVSIISHEVLHLVDHLYQCAFGTEETVINKSNCEFMARAFGECVEDTMRFILSYKDKNKQEAISVSL
jgi:hypothetical protein